MRSALFITFYIALLASCDSERKEVLNLKTIEQQKTFLEDIYHQDQSARKNAKQIEMQYGHDSDELRLANQKMSNTDKKNIKLIKAYLSQYGHPNLQEHGKAASDAPWIVIHHSTELADRYDYFPSLYSAYQNGDIDVGQYTFFLSRMYRIKYGKQISWDGPFSVDDELDTLHKSLELIKIIDAKEH